jgi:chemotaxis protein CheX
MNVNDFIMERIRCSAAEVFSTMLGVELPPGEGAMEASSPEVNDGVVALIGLTGGWVGTGFLVCSPALACRICSLMLMNDVTAVDEEVLDAVAELTNMIVGSVKTDLEPRLGPLGLSIPTVVFGRNFRTRSARSNDWVVVRFPWEGDFLVVKVFLAPVDKTAQSVTAGHHCAVDV